ncbi:hypothetical protein AVW09_01910 [Microbacterium sp. T32]|nr:hypothetical protein AVW09_01910 [Microbacterium sp. T32]
MDRSVALSEGVTAGSIATAVADAVTALENKVVDHDRLAIWDTLEVETTTDRIEHTSFASDREFIDHRTITVSVLTISRNEASA